MSLNFFRRLALAALCLALPAGGVAAGTPLRIAYPSGINGQLPKVIEKAGIAERHGFAPSYTFFQYGPPMIEALAAGEVDMVFTSFNPVASYLAKQPGGLVIVADVGSAKHAVVVPDDSPVRSLADLRGQRIAVSYNSDLHVDVLRSIKDLGLDPAKDFQLLNVEPSELVQAFDQRLAEGVDIRVPPLLVLTGKKGGRVVAEWPWQFVVAVRRGYLDEHPGIADELRRVLAEGVRFIADNADQAAIWWGEHLRLDPTVVRASAELNPLYRLKPGESPDLKPSAEFKAVAQRWARSLVDYGIRKEEVVYVYQ